MNKKIITPILIILVILGVITFNIMKSNTQNASNSAGAPKVLLQTTEGDVTLQMYENMPITTGNFVKLVNQGFYNGLGFHRVIKGFMIQGGDPKGDGTGGPGYTIKDEIFPTNRNDKYTISMANAGPNTGGSQFFINVNNNNFLDAKHPAFGKVIAGTEVVDKIAATQTDRQDKPLKKITILTAKVL